MTLQAFKEAEFESSSLRMTPVQPGKIERIDQLPLLSYRFATRQEDFKVFYNAELLKTERFSYTHPSALRPIVKDMLNGAAGVQAHLADNTTAYYNGPKEFLTQTLTNLIRRQLAADQDQPRGENAAAIHGHGNVYVPLVKGAALHISDDRDFDRIPGTRFEDRHVRWDIIAKGTVIWFGTPRKWYLSHAHCQGFEFVNIAGLMDQLQAAVLSWFPFLEGHICFHDVKMVTNPVSHQDKGDR